MKITHVLWGLTTGGIETMVVNIINHQVEKHSVELILVNDYYDSSLVNQLSPECKLRYCHRSIGSRNPLPVAKLQWFILRFHPDIVHLHSKDLSKIILIPCLKVRTIHNTNNKCEEYPKMSQLFSISKAVQSFTRNQGFDSVVVENGIPTESFTLKTSYYKKGEILHIVQLGRLYTKQKGQHLLIQAVEKLVKNYGRNSIQVHFIGDGEDKSQLEDQIREKHLERYFVFEGIKTQEYLKQHLKDFDLLLQPSLFEGFGLTVAEALAAKLPVLVSDIEGPTEIIDHGKYGQTFQSNDIDSLCDSLLKILDYGFDLKMIEDAYQYVKDKYDVKYTAERYLQEYEKVIKSARHAG